MPWTHSYLWWPSTARYSAQLFLLIVFVSGLLMKHSWIVLPFFIHVIVYWWIRKEIFYNEYLYWFRVRNFIFFYSWSLESQWWKNTQKNRKRNLWIFWERGALAKFFLVYHWVFFDVLISWGCKILNAWWLHFREYININPKKSWKHYDEIIKEESATLWRRE